jgi:endonuclease/exonuclease/phosphatase family metal-dependent hydrolase
MLAFAVALVPRALGGPKPRAAGPRLVVMTSNLYLGQADARAVLRIARERDVDVLSVQELRPGLMRRLDRVGAAELFPERVLDPRERASGSGVLSRTPLRAIDTSPNRTGHADAVGRGFVWTWPARPRGAPPITIDHVLVDRRVRVERVEVVRVPGSDHRAVIATLQLPQA